MRPTPVGASVACARTRIVRTLQSSVRARYFTATQRVSPLPLGAICVSGRVLSDKPSDPVSVLPTAAAACERAGPFVPGAFVAHSSTAMLNPSSPEVPATSRARRCTGSASASSV
jgi:hypothetical protein